MKYIISLAVVVVAFVVLITAEREDHRCTVTEIKIENCNRTVWYPCPTQETSSSEESQEDGDHHDRKRRSIEDFIASIMRWRNRGSNSNVQWCQKQETFRCVMYRCYVACCEGWKYDEKTDTCSIPEDPKPPIECQNGGKAVNSARGWVCECTEMYTGSRCEEAKCAMTCMNDGMCDIVDGQPSCVCSDDFSGPQCEIPNCQGGCGSNGKCVGEEGKATCRCSAGYTGARCEISTAEKEGDCPPVSATTVGTCVTTCTQDSNCPNKMKCCNNGCGRTCLNPANYTCIYQGKKYMIGAVFYPDKCHVCTCLNPDASKEYGGAQCRKPECPAITNCNDVREDEKTCCKYCADGTTGGDYDRPHFVNCPESLVTIDVAHDRNEARLHFTLRARDYLDNELEVQMSRTLFRAGLGEENFDTVIATSSLDSHGNYAYCQFHVRIRDIHAPNITFCPPDVHMHKEGIATWRMPKAVDNVGLVRPPTSRYKPGDHFKKGKHPVVYSCEDYEGNIARCHFFVRVAEHERSHLTELDNDGRHGRHHHHHRKQWLFIGPAIGIFVMLIVIIIVAVMCRRNRRRRESPASAAPPAYENGIYSLGSAMGPPPYKEKPPVYVSDAEPIPEKKAVEEMESDKAALDVGDVDVKVGVDNPTYRM